MKSQKRIEKEKGISLGVKRSIIQHNTKQNKIKILLNTTVHLFHKLLHEPKLNPTKTANGKKNSSGIKIGQVQNPHCQ